MHTTNCKKFKGEIENYVRKGSNIFESKIERAFSALRLKTLLTRNKIKKKDGYHAAHLLFTLTLLPILKVPTVHSFCLRHLEQWSKSRKDTFYRFNYFSTNLRGRSRCTGQAQWWPPARHRLQRTPLQLKRARRASRRRETCTRRRRP